MSVDFTALSKLASGWFFLNERLRDTHAESLGGHEAIQLKLKLGEFTNRLKIWSLSCQFQEWTHLETNYTIVQMLQLEEKNLIKGITCWNFKIKYTHVIINKIKVSHCLRNYFALYK